MDSPNKKSETLPELSKAEWEVMKTLWKKGPLAARDLYAALPNRKGWAYNTVKTILSRLVAKNAVEYEQVGNSYLYRAARPQEQMLHKEIKGFLNRVLDGSLSPLLAHFIEDHDLSDEEIERLKKVLDAKLKKTGSKQKREES